MLGHLATTGIYVVRAGQEIGHDAFGVHAHAEHVGEIAVVGIGPVLAWNERHRRGDLGRLVSRSPYVEKALALFEQGQHFLIEPARRHHQFEDAA